MKKNNKGFTLVELLAVIVVLAIIMVIATQSITNVIKQNTVKSFKSSLDMIAKQAQAAAVLNESGIANVGDIKKLVDYDENEYTISHSGDGIVCIKSTSDGKFDEMATSILKEEFGEGKYKNAGGITEVCKTFGAGGGTSHYQAPASGSGGAGEGGAGTGGTGEGGTGGE